MSYSPNFRGNESSAPALGIQSDFTNGSGLTMPIYTPVCSNSSGDVVMVDVSDESKALSVIGITASQILNGDTGSIVTEGRIKNVALSLAFGSLYISKVGTITDVKPSIGVGGFISGDFIVRVGVLVKNKDNPLNKDIVLNIMPVGQL